MVTPKVRQSGKSASQETVLDASRISEEPDKPSERLVVAPTDLEQGRKFRTPGFQRMRLDWSSDDSIVITKAHAAAEKRIQVAYKEAYHIINQMYDIVRTSATTLDGEIKRDLNGWIVWQVDEYGFPIEDWSRLTHAQRDDFLYRIVVRLYDWEQIAVKAWGDSMMAKGQWEEEFSVSFDEGLAGTIGDREAKGRIGSMDERYFAIYLATYSRHCDAIVRSMTRISQRLKDSLQ